MFQILASTISSLLIAVLCWYLLRGKGRCFPDWMLATGICACGFSELSYLLQLCHPQSPTPWRILSLLAEGCLPWSWLLFSMTFGREKQPHPRLRSRLMVCASLFSLPATLLLCAGLYFNCGWISQVQFAYHFHLLVFVVIALVNLEGTFTSASYGSNWKIRLEIIGSGALLAFLTFYYSQELFYGNFTTPVLPVRSAAFITATLLIFHSRLTRGGPVSIKVSTRMAYNSFVLLSTGVYLVGLGLLGEGTRYFGATFNRSFRITVAFLSAVALITLFLSERFRRTIKVFLHKNFYRNKYDYRVQWLKLTDRLASARTPEEYLDAVLNAFLEVFGMGYGVLYLYDSTRGGYCGAASFGVACDGEVVACDAPIVRYMRETKRVVSSSDPLPGLPAICPGRPFVFTVPLLANDALEGFIALGKAVYPDERYIYEDYDLMKTLARQAVAGLLNIRLARELTTSREMETVGRIAAFLVHDLKNLASSISMMLDNAKEQMDNPQFRQDMLKGLAATVTKMKGLIMKLKGVGGANGGSRIQVDLLEVVENVVSPLAGKGVKVVGEHTDSFIDPDDIRTVVLNLVLNAIEACQGSGDVVVEVGKEETPFVTVTDNGCGIPQDYLSHALFEPFRTTKRKGLGVGLYQCRQIVSSYGGRIQVKSKVGIGSRFTVLLPEVQAQLGSTTSISAPAATGGPQ